MFLSTKSASMRPGRLLQVAGRTPQPAALVAVAVRDGDDREVVEDQGHAGDVARLVEVAEGVAARLSPASSNWRWPTADRLSMCSDQASIVRWPDLRDGARATAR